MPPEFCKYLPESADASLMLRSSITPNAIYSTDNANDIVSYCNTHSSPEVALSTRDGKLLAVHVSGTPIAMEPEPSLALPDGGLYLFDQPIDAHPDQADWPPIAVLDEAFQGRSPEELLTYSGDLKVQNEATRRKISLMHGTKRDERQGRWKSTTSEFQDFQDQLLKHNAGEKDGTCFLQGKSADGRRTAQAMIRNSIMVIDLDSGAPIEEVKQAISGQGLHAVIHTTHSNMKCTSVINRDHFSKWSGGEDPTDKLAADYLTDIKGLRPDLVDECTIVNAAKHTADGVIIVVKHKPIPKFRVILPLTEDFVFARRGGTQKDAIAEWKELYAGVCTKLGLHFDEKCVDPARLFYFPRHPKDDENYGSWVVYGEPLDLDKFIRIKIKRTSKGGKRGPVANNVFSAAAGNVDESDADRYLIGNINLKKWAAKKAPRFEIQTCIEDHADSDLLRDERSGKAGVHIACPFEPEHSSFGGNGTFVVNASDNYDEGFDYGFGVVCTHNACSGRDRLDFLKGMIEEDWFGVECLSDPDYLMEVEDDDRDGQPAPDNQSLLGKLYSNSAPSPGINPKLGSAPTDTDAPFDDDNSEAAHFDYFSKTYSIAKYGGKTIIIAESDDKEQGPKFFTVSAIREFEMHRIVYFPDKTGAPKPHAAFTLWMKSSEARRYTDVRFDPRGTPPDVYNLFKGWTIEPKKGDWSILHQHMLDEICGGQKELFEWLLSYLAHMVQKPWEKPSAALVVKGNKGTGKTVLFEHISEFMQPYFITATRQKHITGGFNGHQENALALLCEEAFWAGDRSVEGILKDLITGKTFLVERKHFEARTAKSYLRVMMTSNNEWVVPASFDDERRFAVFTCGDRRMKDFPFFARMREQMDNGGTAAMLHDLLHHVPQNGWDTLRDPPQTDGLDSQKLESLRGLDRFMYELLQNGLYEASEDFSASSIQLSETHSTECTAIELRAAVREYLKVSYPSERTQGNTTPIAKAAIRWFSAKVEMRINPGEAKKKHQVIIFPPLNEARKKFPRMSAVK